MKIPGWISANALAVGIFIVLALSLAAARLVWAHYMFDDLTCAFSTCVRVKP